MADTGCDMTEEELLALIWRLALRLSGAAGARKHSRRSVREPRELPPLSLSSLPTRADVPGVGESALIALHILKAPPKTHRFSTHNRMPYAFQLECMIS